MISINTAVIDLKRLELMAGGNSPIHALDARAKVLVTFVFIVAVVSYGRYELARLIPFCIFPAVIIALADLPALFLARKIALICPFIAMIGFFNPVFDQTELFRLGHVVITGGWISLVSLIIRSLLTVGAAFILIGTTGFAALCQALERLGIPQLFTVQLLFLYRYIFVLADETCRASRARELRSCDKKGLGVVSFSSLVGHLLLRTWQQAVRIHSAMLARGFVGQFHARRQSRFGVAEFCFVLGWSSLFMTLRLFDISGMIGKMVTGIFP
ncbi:MAG TPA: cobalt ECF transporter T component CbiQ [Desulfuromonadales bacterium]|nr:cobalt ECF transporter T component CbiQ [Desulfuromonadales bacterium]